MADAGAMSIAIPASCWAIMSLSDKLPTTSTRPSLGAGRADQRMAATLARRNTIGTRRKELAETLLDCLL